MNEKMNLLLSAAVAGMIGFTATPALAKKKAKEAKAEKKEAMVKCYGVNACKGQGGCKTNANASCKGQNGCKGQGMMEMTAKECKDKGGSEKDTTTAAPAAGEPKKG